MKIRSPILVSLGHVDHGKTSLLDYIRGTSVVKGEPGAITQHISASYVSSNLIREKCSHLLGRLNIEFTLPGILWIDSPGHEAFTTLRKRGGAIADFAILVVDIMEGFQPQTKESVSFLKQFKTPFAVALTKVDRLPSWIPQKDSAFIDSIENQPQTAKDVFDEKFYRVVGQLGSEGFSAERYDRVEDFSKQVAIVPVSARTGEGIADLLVVIGGIAQKYLKKGLEIQEGEGKGTVLEVKEVPGLGSVIDVILYDGLVRKGDFLLIGGKEVLKSRAKALILDGQGVDEVVAAAGVRIAGPDLEKVMSGSPMRAVRKEADMETAAAEVREEIEEVEFQSDRAGAILKADTLGSLEALIKTMEGIVPVKRAQVGNVSKADIMEAKLGKPVVFAFSVKVPSEVEKLAKESRVTVFSSNVIYSMVEEYRDWEKKAKERQELELLENAVRPARLRALPGFLFRQKKPAVFGVEIIAGTIKPGFVLVGKEGKIGELKEIQDNGESRSEAVKGDKVAISMPDVVFGKDVNEGDEISVFLSERDLEILEKVKGKLRQDERELLENYRI